MSSTPIDQIKSAVKIQDIFADHFEIVGHGSVLTTREHDSLKIWPAQGRWRWYSDKWRDYGHCDHGDVLDAYQLLHRCDLPTAISALAQRAGIELKPLTPAQRQAADEQRAHARAQTQVLTLAANWFHAQLLASPAAQSHLRTKRGWDLPTLTAELIGYNPDPRQSAPSGHLTLDDDSTDKNVLSPQENLPDNSPLPYQGRARVGSLSSTLRDAGLLDHPAATAVLSIPPDMIIYVHRAYGIVTALSTRSVEGKFHYNLKLDLVGNKQLYHNSIRKPSPHLLVEGQADAIALAQLGIAATALCGSARTAEGLANLGLTHVAPDTDAPGQKALPALLLALDPLTRVVRWLPEAKDAADMVKSAPGELQACLDSALTGVETMAILAHRASGEERTTALYSFFTVYAKLNDLAATDYRADLARHLGVPVSQFNRLHKAWRNGNDPASPAEAPADSDKPKQAEQLYNLALEQCHVFTSSNDGKPYASIQIDGHTECYALHGRKFLEWLSHAYQTAYGTLVNGQSRDDVKSLLGFAARSNNEEVFHRVGQLDGKIYIDMATPTGEAIEIDATGWRIIPVAPVHFRRSEAMKPIPPPVEHKDPLILSRYINIDLADWPLVAAWVTMAFNPTGPFPILAFLSRAGSGKSTALRVLKRIIDPSKAELRSQPCEIRQLFIAASNCWLLAFDNVSQISPEVADALCIISTGGGFTTRANYTDGDEHVINVQRPIVINGIGDVITRQDLIDRAIVIGTPYISEENRQDEKDFWSAFEEDRPKLLGAFLFALSTGLANLATTKLTAKPRMADFAKLAVAAESAYTDGQHGFMVEYTANRERSADVIVDNSPVGEVLMRLLGDGDEIKDTPSDLYLKLCATAKDYEKAANGWPKHHNQLKEAMERIAPALDRLGIRSEYKRSNTKRILRVWRTPITE